MINRSLAPALLVLCIACKPSPPEAAKTATAAAPGGPRVKATVVTIETALQPANKTLTHTITIANDRARSSDELDSWRLFDLKKRSVTFVDDLAKTYRTETFDALAKKYSEAAARPLPDGVTPARYQIGESKNVNGIPMRLSTIRAGGYQRDIWIAVHPQIPQDLFRLMHASAAPSSPYAGMNRAMGDALLQTTGFPFDDHAELTYGEKKLVIDRKVTRVEQQEVLASILEIPRDYKDITPKPDENRRSASSPPRGRTTPGAGSRSSATGRSNP